MNRTTLCEHCIFKTMENGKQVGCQLGRLDKFKNHTEGNFVVIDSYCSTCRNVYWEHAQGAKTLQELINTVMEEVKLQYDVIVVCEEEDSKESIRKTLDNINLKSYKPMRVITTSQMNERNEDMVRRLASEYSNRFTFMLSSETELPLRLKPVIDKCKSPFLLFVNPGNDYDDKIIYEFNEALNVQCKPKFVFASEKFYICPRFLYVNYMYEENPFEEINKYVQSVSSVDKRSDS